MKIPDQPRHNLIYFGDMLTNLVIFCVWPIMLRDDGIKRHTKQDKVLGFY